MTRKLDGLSLHSALQLLLNDLGLTYVIRDDTLVITSQEEGQRLARQGVIHADDVKRELEQSPAFRRRRRSSRRPCRIPLNSISMQRRFGLAVDFIKTRYGIPIELDTRELDNVDDRIFDARCTLRKGVKLASALDKMLVPLGLTYVAAGEYILITAPENGPQGGQRQGSESHKSGYPRT